MTPYEYYQSLTSSQLSLAIYVVRSNADYSLLALCVIASVLSCMDAGAPDDSRVFSSLSQLPGLPENGEAEEGETLIYDASRAN